MVKNNAVLVLRNSHFSWKDDELLQTNYSEVRAVVEVRMLWKSYKPAFSKRQPFPKSMDGQHLSFPGCRCIGEKPSWRPT